ncbi:MAG: ArsI/CadI family heavy metal resistance metalloenzyme [Candidatus Velthaea sp.]|jgi:catechol 2,3-dioxygenase-like lactoylglutathione lyase family enzyme
MKMHLNLATRDLDASVAFYRTLLLAEPAKHYADYALFVTDEPGLELALDQSAETDVREGAHYGVVVEKPEDVDAAIVRLRAAGYPIDVERGETCCYAVQSKVWATDPDGRRWETYFVVAESDERASEETSCCGGPAASETDACCVTDADAKAAGAAGCGCGSKTIVAQAAVGA